LTDLEVPTKDLHLTSKIINLMAQTREAFRLHAAYAVERTFNLWLPLGDRVDEVAHKRAVVSELLKRGLGLLHEEVTVLPRQFYAALGRTDELDFTVTVG
jgi:hypothetical protein